MYPLCISAELKDLLERIFVPAEDRISLTEEKNSKWFADLDWDALNARKLVSPLKGLVPKFQVRYPSMANSL